MTSEKKDPIINTLTGTEETLKCKTLLLGESFDLEICIAADGRLMLSIDGNSNIGEIIQVISAKCKAPIEAIIPLLVTNLALVQYRAEDSIASAMFGRNFSEGKSPTIH